MTDTILQQLHALAPFLNAFLLVSLGYLLGILGSCVGAIIGAVRWAQQTQSPVVSFRQVAVPALCVFFSVLFFALFLASKIAQTPGPHQGPFGDL
jgi:hypothetical protein